MVGVTTIPPEVRAEILRLHDLGLTGVRKLSDATGVNRSTLRRFLKSQGIESGPHSPAWTDAETAVVKPLYENGATCRSISEALAKAGYNRTKKAVEAHARNLGLKNPRNANRKPPRPRSEGAGGPTPLIGEPETRDAKFVALVRAAGGTPVAVKGVGWVWPYRKAA